ncbi:cuticle protein 7 [Drosophila obscura]|uniref:cuticle protein 7 n=1 Tax=Drosophila obscura TaxID=7282 RepID=UPI000BA012F3|nr:cuticle protein 7 [Drosophila obscura]
MMGKVSFLFCACLALTLALSGALELQPELDSGPVAYEFHWSVNDPHTGDIKSQKEVRKDDKVEGVYELIDSDGYRRIVQYKADDHNGFEAIVHREPTDIKIPLPEAPKKLIAAKLVAAPLVAAPLVHYAAPKALIRQEQALSPGNYVSVSGPTAQYKY